MTPRGLSLGPDTLQIYIFSNRKKISFMVSSFVFSLSYIFLRVSTDNISRYIFKIYRNHGSLTQLNALLSVTIFKQKGIKDSLPIYIYVYVSVMATYPSRESFRAERDRGDFFSRRIYFKVREFMQEATVGAKDFSICRIRGRQHVHRRSKMNEYASHS